MWQMPERVKKKIHSSPFFQPVTGWLTVYGL